MKKLLCLLSALCATFFLSSCFLLESVTPLGPGASSSSEQSSSSSQAVASEETKESVFESLEQSSIEEASSEESSIEESSSEESSSEESSIEESSSEESSSEESSIEESSIEESSSEESSIEESSSEESSSENSSTSEEPEESPYEFTDFTEWEKKVFLRYVGEVLPFPATNYYGFEGYYYADDYQDGINFYTNGNTKAEFNAYRRQFSSYTLTETYTDDFGDTWYCYEKDDIVVDMSYYYYNEKYWIDVYVFSYSLSDGVVDEDLLGGGNGGNEDIGGDNEDVGGGNEDIGGGDENVGGEENSDLLTNEGKGLPEGKDGVYKIDFTKATYVKDVTDQGYYLDGCPTTGSPAVLVIPVEFSDIRASSKGYTIDKIKSAFYGENSETTYYSLRNYYYTASYGALDLDITVLDYWFMPKMSSVYYERQTMDYYGSDIFIGDQMVMDEALAKLSLSMDLSKYDSDGNGFIDSIVFVTTLNINSQKDFTWAYRYWNLYTDNEGYYYEYDGVSANDYVWAPYLFMHEEVDKYGNTVYTNTSIINPYTYIHEFGHILGADDYYDTAYVNPPMNGYDIMDGMIGDHNAYTKFNYGWLTSSRLVVAEDTVTLTLENFSQNGDTIIIANNWDESLGAYQEYYVLVYYKNTGLNGGDYGYFANNGIVVYHVNASLYKEVSDGETYYDVYNNNTDASSQYGTEDNLLEFVRSTSGAFVYLAGATISAETTDDQGNKIAYTFTVDSLTSTTATITFKKNNASTEK